jgi:NADPH:quinone reductase-like Zn-dependent oxidoreductase
MAPKAHAMEIKPSSRGVPEANQILIRNHAIAINPIDGKLQKLAVYPIEYPTILGQDVAGEVISVGPGVTRFQPGDRVMGFATAFVAKKLEMAGFQEYTVLDTTASSRIPDAMSYESAAVAPLGIATAASGLFLPDQLGLQLPSVPSQKPNGQTLLIWGGASCVGSSAIQLAVAAGYEVITTASPKNFESVKRLGPTEVFDYKSPSVGEDIIAALKGKQFAGTFDAVGGAAWAPCLEVTSKVDGVKFVSTVTPGFPAPEGGVAMKQTRSIHILGTPIIHAVFEEFLPKALESGSFVPAPEPLVVGKGLGSIQDAIEVVLKGMSAQKAVVVL